MAKQFVRQHEPLRVPRGWTEQDRALVIQMNRLLDEVYEVQGKFNEAQGKFEQRLAELGVASGMDVANNLTTTSAGFLLDARQGPVINDMLSSLTGPAKIIESAIDFDDYLTVGTYAITRDTIAENCTNRPCDSAGRLVVWNLGNSKSFDGELIYGGQFYVDSQCNCVYLRWIKTDGDGVISYGPWKALVASKAVDSGVQYIKKSGFDSFIGYRRVGDVVSMFMTHKASVATIGTWENYFFTNSFPEEYRPDREVMVRCVNDRTSSVGCAFIVGLNGNVYINGRYTGLSDTNDILYASATYLVAQGR